MDSWEKFELPIPLDKKHYSKLNILILAIKI